MASRKAISFRLEKEIGGESKREFMSCVTYQDPRDDIHRVVVSQRYGTLSVFNIENGKLERAAKKNEPYWLEMYTYKGKKVSPHLLIVGRMYGKLSIYNPYTMKCLTTATVCSLQNCIWRFAILENNEINKIQLLCGAWSTGEVDIVTFQVRMCQENHDMTEIQFLGAKRIRQGIGGSVCGVHQLRYPENQNLAALIYNCDPNCSRNQSLVLVDWTENQELKAILIDNNACPRGIESRYNEKKDVETIIISVQVAVFMIDIPRDQSMIKDLTTSDMKSTLVPGSSNLYNILRVNNNSYLFCGGTTEMKLWHSNNVSFLLWNVHFENENYEFTDEQVSSKGVCVSDSYAFSMVNRLVWLDDESNRIVACSSKGTIGIFEAKGVEREVHWDFNEKLAMEDLKERIDYLFENELGWLDFKMIHGEETYELYKIMLL